jgi:hypothetical protein
VIGVWRVYRNEHDLSGVSDAIDVLKIFTERFGIKFRIGGTEANFLASKFLPYIHEPKIIMLQQLPFHASCLSAQSKSFQSGTQTPLDNHVREVSFTAVSLAYCIDLGQYQLCLRSHGVEIFKRPTVRMSKRAIRETTRSAPKNTKAPPEGKSPPGWSQSRLLNSSLAFCPDPFDPKTRLKASSNIKRSLARPDDKID